MHILDTTYWYLDLVSITYFVYIVHTVHVYIYICRPRNHSSSNNRLGCWENPPSPATGGGGTHLAGGGGVWGSLLIYIYPIVFPFIYHPHCNSMHHPMNNWPLLAQSCPEKTGHPVLAISLAITASASQPGSLFVTWIVTQPGYRVISQLLVNNHG